MRNEVLNVSGEPQSADCLQRTNLFKLETQRQPAFSSVKSVCFLDHLNRYLHRKFDRCFAHGVGLQT